MAHHILVVEDEKRLNALIRDYLVATGFEVDSAYDGLRAIELFRADTPDLVILDIMLPGLDGLDVARRIRAESDTPIILLTARVEEADKLIGFEIGADDYVTKPFSVKELAARIRAVLRRPQGLPRSPGAMEHLGIRVDPEKRTVHRDGEHIPLTTVQFDLLRLLMSHPGRVFTRSQILGAVTGSEFEGYERTVDVHIKNIRKAMETDPKHPRYVLTVWGVGYKLVEAVEEQ